MDNFVSGKSAVLEICRALELNPVDVAQIRIVCLPGDVTKVIVTKHLTRNGSNMLMPTLQKFRLVPEVDDG